MAVTPKDKRARETNREADPLHRGRDKQPDRKRQTLRQRQRQRQSERDKSWERERERETARERQRDREGQRDKRDQHIYKLRKISASCLYLLKGCPVSNQTWSYS